MIRTIWVALLITLSSAISPGTIEPPNIEPMKIKIVKPWKEENIFLVRPGSSSQRPPVSSKTQQLSALRAVFEFVPKRDPAKNITQFSILIVSDPFTKQKVFIEGEHSFYISKNSGLTGITVGPGVLVWSESYFKVPESENTNTAIEKFQRTFDSRKLDESWEKRATVNRAGFSQALPRYYCSDAPVAGTGIVAPKVEGIDVTDNILRLEIQNPVRNIPATIWIDLQERKPIKSIVDGKEMDLSAVGTNRTYAVPLNSN
jgi:hypothetical protein